MELLRPIFAIPKVTFHHYFNLLAWSDRKRHQDISIKKQFLLFPPRPTDYNNLTGFHRPDFFPITNLATPTSAARLTRQKEEGKRLV